MRTKEDALKYMRSIEPKFLTEVQKQAMLRLQIGVEEFLHAIFDNVPDSAERTVAVRKLLECKMNCNQAITHTGFEPAVKETKNAKEKEGQSQAKSA